MKNFKQFSIIALVLICFIIMWTQYCKSNNLAKERKNELIERESELVEIYKEFKDIRDRIGTKRDSIVSLLLLIDNQDGEIQSSYAAIDTLYKELDLKISETQTLLDQNEQSQKEISKYRDKLNKFQAEYEQINNDREKVQKQAFWGAMSTRNKLINNLKLQLVEKDNIIREKDRMIAYRDKIINKQKEQLISKDSIITKLIEEKDISQELRDKLKTDLDKSKDAISLLDDELKNSNAKINNKDKMINNLDKKIKEKSKMVNTIAKSSFKASYKFKEERRGEIVAELDMSRKHKRRHVKTINISFIISENMIDAPNNTMVLVELFDNSTNKLVSPDYSKDVLIQNYEGNTLIVINKKLKKGIYYFKVSYHDELLFKEKFKISSFLN